MVEGDFAEFPFLIWFLEVLQPYKVQRLVTNVDVIDFTQLKIWQFDLNYFLNVSALWTVPLDIFGN